MLNNSIIHPNISLSSVFYVIDIDLDEGYNNIDFIDVGIGGFRWYTFNIADSAVTVGVILYLLHSLFIIKPELIQQND